MRKVELREMPASALRGLGAIDRSEHITVGYRTDDGRLVRESVDWQVPRWPDDGPDDFSVRGLVDRWTPVVLESGLLLGAFADDKMLGFAILRYELAPGVAELAALYVDRGARRSGVGRALTLEIEQRARSKGAHTLYVSSTPSESAVGFYLSQGFTLATDVNEQLVAKEPDDIQMAKALDQ